MPEPTFKQGDAVKWIHGDSPIMYVAKVSPNEIACQWFTAMGEFRQHGFPPGMVTLFEDSSSKNNQNPPS